MEVTTINLLYPYIKILFLINFILNSIVIFIWSKEIYLRLGFKKYIAVQRIHENETPRLGGLIFILSLAIICLLEQAGPPLKIILLSIIPTVLISCKEDLYHNVKARIRFFYLILSASFFCILYEGPFPDLNGISIISPILFFPGGIFILFIIGIITVANGMNLIDGVNGLCGFTAIVILSSLLFLAYKVGDALILKLSLNAIILLIPFIILNYPQGKIFLGDLGAYSLGLLVSMLSIIFFGRHPDLSPWNAILILIYPLTEAAFTLIRRTLKGIVISRPDIAHLHLRLFQLLCEKIKYKDIANYLATLILTPIWLFPIISTCWAYKNNSYIFISILLFLFSYNILFCLIPNKKKKKT